MEEPLKKGLAGKRSLDAQRRLEELLKRLGGEGPVEEWRRLERGLEVIEQIGGAPAIEIVKKMAAGGDFGPTRQAKAALERMQREP